jgi:hypothetical protein
MDIPAPAEEAAKKPTADSVASTDAPSAAKTTPSKLADQLAAEQQKIAELIEKGSYRLGIKDRHTGHVIRLVPLHKKKNKHVARPKFGAHVTTQTVASQKLQPKKNRHLLVYIIAAIALLAAFYAVFGRSLLT